MKEKKPLSNKWHTIFWGVFSLIMFVLDLGTKWFAQLLLTPGEKVAVINNFFYLNLSYNTGIAFSLPLPHFVEVSISFIVSVIVAVYFFAKRNELKPFTKAILALIFAGALGNFIDRAFYTVDTVGFEGVIDFAQFYLGGGPSAKHTMFNPFATFNVADACLTIGVILFMLDIVIDEFKNKENDLSKDPRIESSDSKDKKEK